MSKERDNLLQSINNLESSSTELNKFSCNKAKFLQMILSSTVGLGTGLAMMPIFDAEIEKLEDIGIEIEDGPVVNAAITVNTLCVFTSMASITLYFFMRDNNRHESSELQKIALNLGKVAAICSTILPLSQLWTVELEDQAYSDSVGFSQYIAWAAATSIPLCIYRSVDAFEYIEGFIHNTLKHVELDSIGSKLFLYLPSALSFVGRFIAYSASAAYLGTEIGISEGVSIVLGTLIGGVAGSTVIGIAEYQSLKELFAKQEEPLTCMQFIGGTICALEGLLLTLPLVTTGLTAVSEWNPFIKGALFSPLLVSHALLEGRNIYKAFSMLINSFKSETEYVEVTEESLIYDDDQMFLVGDYGE